MLMKIQNKKSGETLKEQFRIFHNKQFETVFMHKE